MLCASQYEAGAALHQEPGWVALAERLGFARLRFDLQTADERLKLAKDRSAAEAILQALEAFARQSAHPELARAGLVVAGISQGGWQAVAFSNLLPERMIAALAIHEATPAPGRDAAAGDDPAGWVVPQLHVVGGSCFLTPLIHPWVARARARGALWSEVLQPGTGHADLGDLSFAYRWLEAVAALRLPEDRASSPLRPIPPWSGWVGRMELSWVYRQTRSATPPPVAEGQPPPGVQTTLADAAIAPAAQVHQGDGAWLWLPDGETARAWLEAVRRPARGQEPRPRRPAR